MCVRVHTKVWVKVRGRDSTAGNWGRKIAEYLQRKNIEVYVDPILHHSVSLPQLSEHEAWQTDLAVIVGGDGTLLQAVQRSGAKLPPIVGFTVDSLGYLLPHKAEDYVKVLDNVVKGLYSVRKVLLGEFSLGEHRGLFLNEVSIWGLRGKLIEYSLYVNDMEMFKARSDGVIVSTPAGSTAHALSYGGPILLNLDKPMLEIVFAGGLSSLLKPLVIYDSSVSIKVERHPAYVVVDGQRELSLEYSQTVSIRPSHTHIELIVAEPHVDPLEKLYLRLTDLNRWKPSSPTRDI
uniref:NAD kinase n=1 Tax=Thermofilum pendens TaxID=2269 RepID=A0A7C4BAS0_THEPE